MRDRDCSMRRRRGTLAMWCSTAMHSAPSHEDPLYGSWNASATATSARPVPTKAGGRRRAAARLARPVLRSEASIATSGRTWKYFPLPQPTSATTSPASNCSRKARTLGHTANLVALKCGAIVLYTSFTKRSSSCWHRASASADSIDTANSCCPLQSSPAVFANTPSPTPAIDSCCCCCCCLTAPSEIPSLGASCERSASSDSAAEDMASAGTLGCADSAGVPAARARVGGRRCI
mmetsp:Transcript_794/g.2447  ORF Transcript_794/g.2447 Transcript_794/m.2447 type:complete len:235 (+) Transcript_794:4397-5101(+)